MPLYLFFYNFFFLKPPIKEKYLSIFRNICLEYTLILRTMYAIRVIKIKKNYISQLHKVGFMIFFLIYKKNLEGHELNFVYNILFF